MNTPQTGQKSYGAIIRESMAEWSSGKTRGDWNQAYETAADAVISAYRRRMREGHRLLQVGEVIREGDEYANPMRIDDGDLLAWMPSKNAGKKVSHVNCAIRRRCLLRDDFVDRDGEGKVVGPKAVREPEGCGVSTDADAAPEKIRLIPEEIAAPLRRYISQDSTLLSMLYDMDWMPEQVEAGSRQERRMLLLAETWRNHVESLTTRPDPKDEIISTLQERVRFLEARHEKEFAEIEKSGWEMSKARLVLDNLRNRNQFLEDCNRGIKPQLPEKSLWVSVTERMPAKSDADEREEVLWAYTERGHSKLKTITEKFDWDCSALYNLVFWTQVPPLPRTKDAFEEWFANSSIDESLKHVAREAFAAATQHATQKS